MIGKRRLQDIYEQNSYSRQYFADFNSYYGYVCCLHKLKPFDEVEICIDDYGKVCLFAELIKKNTKTIKLSVITYVDAGDRLYIGSNVSNNNIYVSNRLEEPWQSKVNASPNKLAYLRFVHTFDLYEGTVAKAIRHKTH